MVEQGGGDPIMRYVEFVKTILRDLDNEPLLETFLRKGVASQTLGEEFARSRFRIPDFGTYRQLTLPLLFRYACQQSV